MLLGLVLGCALAAADPPAADGDRASRELLLYLAEFGSGEDAVDPLELDHADLPDPATPPKPDGPRNNDRTTTTDHAAPAPKAPPH